MHLVGGLSLCLYCCACAWASQRIQIATLLWWSIRLPEMGTSVLHTLTCRRSAMIDFIFQQSWSTTTPTAWIWWRNASISTTYGLIHSGRALGKSHAPLCWTPMNSASSFAWPCIGTAFTHVIHILHVLWGLRVVALLKPSRDSGTLAGSPPILLPKELTRSNIAPRTLFGFRVFFHGVKFSSSAKQNPYSCAIGC